MPSQLVAAYQASPLLFWIAGSVLVYALATNAAWVTRQAVKKRALRLPLPPTWLAETCALLFFVGVPYLALGGWPLPPYSGLLSPADLGLASLGGDWPAARWLEAAGTGLALGLVAVLTLGVGWGLANRGRSRLGLQVDRWWQLPVHGLYREVHWAFYRAALALTLSPVNLGGDVYVGVWGGLALILVEWSINPAWRDAWRNPERAGDAWLGVGLALLSSLLFLLTRNLWICVAVHWLVSGTLAIAARLPSVEPA